LSSDYFSQITFHVAPECKAGAARCVAENADSASPVLRACNKSAYVPAMSYRAKRCKDAQSKARVLLDPSPCPA
jgi:hypothetical protein